MEVTSGTDKETEKALRCLEPNRKLNDTVIDFYLNHLLSNSKSMYRGQFHLFNTFLYRKLKTLAHKSTVATSSTTPPSFPTNRRQRSTSELRWDKNVDIFEKNFLVIPVCDCDHWLLVIVCFPGHSPTHTYNKPCFVIFDSLGFKYTKRFTEPIRTFLQQRWERDKAAKGKRNFLDREVYKELQAVVPRQSNAYDCGIHLLHNFEKFLEMPLSALGHIRRNELLHYHCDTNGKRRQLRCLLLESMRAPSAP